MHAKSYPHESAVMVLHEEASDSLILTQRSVHLREHPGEICFPGGRWEEGDVNLQATALRELQEELGIDARRIQGIKALKFEKTLRGHVIHPWFASIFSLHPYQPNLKEVSLVITVAMSLVKDSHNYQDMMIEQENICFKSCYFTASNHFIWGATARIMKQLCLL